MSLIFPKSRSITLRSVCQNGLSNEKIGGRHQQGQRNHTDHGVQMQHILELVPLESTWVNGDGVSMARKTLLLQLNRQTFGSSNRTYHTQKCHLIRSKNKITSITNYKNFVKLITQCRAAFIRRTEGGEQSTLMIKINGIIWQ
jgi:hypothetical protein